MYFSAVLKVTDRLRRAEMIRESYLLLYVVIIRRERAQLAVVVPVGLVRLLSGFADRAAAAVRFRG